MDAAAHGGDAADACGGGGGAVWQRDGVPEMRQCAEAADGADGEAGGVSVLWVFAVSGLSVCAGCGGGSGYGQHVNRDSNLSKLLHNSLIRVESL